MSDENNNIKNTKLVMTFSDRQDDKNSSKASPKKKIKTESPPTKRIGRRRLKPSKFEGENRGENQGENETYSPLKSRLCSMPFEILHKIISYLNPRDRVALRRTSKFFEAMVIPGRLKESYRIYQSEDFVESFVALTTAEVINDLKRMPHLKYFHIHRRRDIKEILKQICESNSSLETLHIRGPREESIEKGNKNLQITKNMIKVLESCPKLHTLSVERFSFRCGKFYEKLGEISSRLRFFKLEMRHNNCETFVNHMNNLNSIGRNKLLALSLNRPKHQWGCLKYTALESNTSENLAELFYSFSRKIRRRGLGRGLKRWFGWSTSYLTKNDIKSNNDEEQ